MSVFYISTVVWSVFLRYNIKTPTWLLLLHTIFIFIQILLPKTTMHVAKVCKITNVSGNLQNNPVRIFAKQFILSIILNSENTYWLDRQNINMHVCVFICTRSRKVMLTLKTSIVIQIVRTLFLIFVCIHVWQYIDTNVTPIMYMYVIVY